MGRPSASAGFEDPDSGARVVAHSGLRFDGLVAVGDRRRMLRR